jgi:hypothetical protein
VLACTDHAPQLTAELHAVLVCVELGYTTCTLLPCACISGGISGSSYDTNKRVELLTRAEAAVAELPAPGPHAQATLAGLRDEVLHAFSGQALPAVYNQLNDVINQHAA